MAAATGAVGCEELSLQGKDFHPTHYCKPLRGWGYTSNMEPPVFSREKLLTVTQQCSDPTQCQDVDSVRVTELFSA